MLARPLQQVAVPFDFASSRLSFGKMLRFYQPDLREKHPLNHDSQIEIG
jgi:hypothetical protein